MKYEKIFIKLLSDEAHLSQILTGFCLLERNNRELKAIYIKDYECGNREAFPGPFLLAEYRGKRIVYDMLDGYNMPEAIQYYLEHCDYYFKRSYSEQKNEDLELTLTEKMYPLGFNYHVSCMRHPLDKPEWKEQIKQLCGKDCNRWSSTFFSYKKFEETPKYSKSTPKVLFSTRLWGDEDLDRMRIEIVRMLKSHPGIDFVGGITDSPLARRIASDIIVSRDITERRNYLKLMHECDICIATTGLHDSIGWKTGEYVASAKAIVSEKLCYQVPGDFKEGKNYLEFSTAAECLEAVVSLIADPQKMLLMKQANSVYYRTYLRPDVLVRNTLKKIDKML